MTASDARVLRDRLLRASHRLIVRAERVFSSFERGLVDAAAAIQPQIDYLRRRTLIAVNFEALGEIVRRSGAPLH